MLQTRNLVLSILAVCSTGVGPVGFDRACLAPAASPVFSNSGAAVAPIGEGAVGARSGALGAAALPRVTPVTAPPVLGLPSGSDRPDVPAEVLPSGWTGNKADNICGIDDLRKVSNPAEVDYPDLMASTPQMQRIEKDGIDPDSPQGKLLRQEAIRLITKSCEVVRRRKGFCGIWKEIAHQDERAIPDATSDVKAEMK